ncbi:unnamed protein product [Adineta steineri]|uniref:Transmembrane protein n=1 Tax=Adineta steineri TaxID=433720 RepID=A0A813Z068_9BILA|nr:unnamed protein product [Adineta steineri]CAF0891752.1 unnamed protein product [Adineta steineri]
MRYSKSLCPKLFVCTAFLCWNSKYLNYSFSNITQCTPSPLYFETNIRFIPKNLNYQKKYSIHGYSCSKCTQENFIEYNIDIFDQCFKQTTMIELKNSCQHKRLKSDCQCYPANQSIQPIHDWVKAIEKSGKSHMNVIRVNNINESAITSVYFLIGSFMLILIFGGFIGMIFYKIKLKSMQQQIFKETR